MSSSPDDTSKGLESAASAAPEPAAAPPSQANTTQGQASAAPEPTSMAKGPDANADVQVTVPAAQPEKKMKTAEEKAAAKDQTAQKKEFDEKNSLAGAAKKAVPAGDSLIAICAQMLAEMLKMMEDIDKIRAVAAKNAYDNLKASYDKNVDPKSKEQMAATYDAIKGAYDAVKGAAVDLAQGDTSKLTGLYNKATEAFSRLTSKDPNAAAGETGAEMKNMGSGKGPAGPQPAQQPPAATALTSTAGPTPNPGAGTATPASGLSASTSADDAHPLAAAPAGSRPAMQPLPTDHTHADREQAFPGLGRLDSGTAGTGAAAAPATPPVADTTFKP